MKRLCAAVGIAGLMTTAGHAARVPQVDSSRGCSFYKSGLSFMDEKKFKEALDDFQKVVDSCTTVPVKAQALLQQGHIYLNQSPPNFAEARRVANTIGQSPYLDTPSAPDGLILLGLIELREARNFETAQNQFRRLGSITASSTSLAEAQFWTAETLRIAHQPQDALRRFEDVTLRYPAMSWKAMALLGSASCYVQMGDMVAAMESLQRVRRDFPRSREADLALKRTTILHRLTMRGPLQASQPPVALGPGRLREGVGLVIDGSGRVVLGYRDGVAILPSATATAFQPRALDAPEASPSAVGLGPNGVIALARERFLALDLEKAEPWSPVIPQREGNPEPVEVRSVATKWNGEWLIGDGRTDAIQRFSATGAYLGPFAENVQARRMIRNDIDDLAVVNGRTRGIAIFARDGGAPREIPRRGVDYEWDNPSDISFDSLGNIYVLDGAKSVIHVFDPGLKFRTTIQLAIKGTTQLKKAFALVVDDSGRIYVLDRDGQQVLAYQ
jgi:TolA-binding protein